MNLYGNRLALALALHLLIGCSTQPTLPPATTATAMPRQGNEVVIYALNLMDRDYKFGGSNPDTGLDCSGMVSYIFQQSVGIRLPHNARKIALAGKVIRFTELLPGDLVFFNTNGQSFSHVGIYIGDGRFIHAPKHNGKIRTDSLSSGYFKDHLEAARTFF